MSGLAREEVRVVRGRRAERIYGGIPEAVLLSDNHHLAEVVERELEREGWIPVWLSEGMDDYAVLFVKPENVHDAVFMLLDAEGKLFLMDGEEVAGDPAMAFALVRCAANYFRHHHG